MTFQISLIAFSSLEDGWLGGLILSAHVIRLTSAQGIAEACPAEMHMPEKGTSWTAQMRARVPSASMACTLSNLSKKKYPLRCFYQVFVHNNEKRN